MQIDLEEKYSIQIHKLLYAFRREAKENGVPYDFFLGAMIQEIILGFVNLEMDNDEFMEAMEDAWYKYSPIVAKHLDELEKDKSSTENSL